MEKAHLLDRGAAGLELEGGGMEMSDAPMTKVRCSAEDFDLGAL